jgi:hypothetical protein
MTPQYSAWSPPPPLTPAITREDVILMALTPASGKSTRLRIIARYHS